MKPLIFYFTADYPSRDVLTDFIRQTDERMVKYVELGIPTENPIYDGPTIKTTHSLARKGYARSDLKHFSGLLAEKGISTFVLAYFNEISGGDPEFLRYLRESGVSGIIVPDLLMDHFEERVEVISRIEDVMDFIPFFNPATPDSVIEEVASMTSSWIYYGLQPSTGINVPYDLDEVSRRILELIPGREVNFGFGVRTVSQVKEIISLGSSGVAIGSLFVKMLKEGDLNAFQEFQENIREAMKSAE